MAGGFSFPPPPPPPPKPAAQQQQQPDFDYSQQAGRGGRGRSGFEPRGRGGPGRGRGGGQGNSNFEPLGQYQRSNFNQGPATAQSRGRYEAPANLQPPPGSHINPNFTGQRQGTAPVARYQQGTGSQSLGASGSEDHPSTDKRTNYTADRRNLNDGPGRTQAGHKRKLDALRGPQEPREKKPGPQTAPSVPSFGAPILPPVRSSAAIQHAVQPQAPNAPTRAQAGLRSLGLTLKEGGEPDYPSESEDDEIDEEAQFAELGTKLTFEHNGEVMTLNNEADLAAWKEERKRQFPTSNRVSQKQVEALRIGEERKRLLAAVARLHQAPRNRNVEAKTRSLHEPPKATKEDTSPMPPNASVEELTGMESDKPSSTSLGIQEIEDPLSNPQVQNVTSSIDDQLAVAQVPARVHHNEFGSMHESRLLQQGHEEPRGLPGINMDESEDESDAEDATTGKLAGVEAPAESEAESSPDADSDDDGPPEQVSSKPRPSASSDAQRPVCRYFSASGRCRDGDSCRFRHELSSKAPSARPAQPQPDKPAYDRFAPKLDPKVEGRKSIFERLVEQEEQSDDRLALQVIKALGEAGFFN